MRVKKICVTSLFGIFNHEIPLNIDERLTIIHGPNGFGKTILLKMIDGVFNARYSVFQTTPFETFCIEFDEGSYIKVTQSEISEKNQKPSVEIELFNSKIGKPEIFTIEDPERFNRNAPQLSLENYIKGLKPLGTTQWYYAPTDKTLSTEEVFLRFSKNLPESYIQKFEKSKNLQKVISVYLIQTQRLELQSTDTRSNRPTVIQFAEQLAEKIKIQKADFADLSQSLDRTFPSRILTAAINSQNEADIRSKLTALEKQQQHLQTVGLLDKNEDTGFQALSSIDERKRDVLSVYIEDMEKKLSVYDNLANKIELFKTIVNARFHYKKLSINAERGIVFSNPLGQIIPLDKLSSGEQHQLVILYELLFKVQPNSLILIDEPELSLHVGWQVEVVKDLKQIADLVQLDILIATHSPELIHDRWDLTVALTRPNE